MLRFTLTIGALLAALSVPAFAQEKAALPKGPPPEFVIVHSVDKDKDTVLVTAPTNVHVTKAKEQDVQVVISGKVVTERRTITYTEPVLEYRMVIYSLRDAGVHATDGTGKKLEKAELFEKLTANKTIAIARAEGGLDPIYRSVLAKDAVIVVVPPKKSEQ